MSVCYHLNCHDCQEYIWIAQGGSCFYYGELKTMMDLGTFLFEHEGHGLSFDGDNQFDDYKDYQKKGVNNASTHESGKAEEPDCTETVEKVKEV